MNRGLPAAWRGRQNCSPGSTCLPRSGLVSFGSRQHSSRLAEGKHWRDHGGNPRASCGRVLAGEQDDRLLLPFPGRVGCGGGEPRRAAAGAAELRPAPRSQRLGALRDGRLPSPRGPARQRPRDPVLQLSGQGVRLRRPSFRSRLELDLRPHARRRWADAHHEEPTLRRAAPGMGPAIDLTAAEAGHLSWAAFPDQSGYPTKFYTSLTTPPGSANVHHPNEFIPMAKAGLLPEIVYVWSPAGYDEHPPFVSDPSYITKGQNLVWDRVQAVIDGGGWENTTFILTWDDWGGYADSVPTPVIETLPDAVHPAGFAAIGGSRIPLVMFGGKVSQQIDPEWHSHASIPKTIIDLLGLPPLGVPRVDAAPSLAHYVHKALTRPAP